MIPLLLALVGAAALGAAVVILRSFGPRYRVGRLLAAAPRVSVADAIRVAESGRQSLVRVDGRIESDAAFEDEAHRPLVLRRRTFRWRPPEGRDGDRDWVTFDQSTEGVDFVVREGMDEIGVATRELADGLIVVPRISQGVARDLGSAVPDAVPADAEVALTVEQVSSVEHATVAGVPRREPDGRIVIGSGLGRPLVLTTLERDEAMRVLTGGATGRARLAVACLAAGGVLIGAAAVWFVLDAVLGGATAALAASPDPTLRPGGDTRTPGSGPGFVGEPLLAIVGVAALGILSVVGTLAYVRWTGGRRAGGPPGR